jgi:hypothetical protein
MALKSDDNLAVLGCHHCHTALDGSETSLYEPYDDIFNKALKRTHAYWEMVGVVHQKPKEIQ